MKWILLIMILLVGWFILSTVIQQTTIKRITKRANEISNKLQKLIDNKSDIGIETYSRWLEQTNPERLWVRILAHTTGNKKLRGELGAKLWQTCEAMNRIIELDHITNLAIQTGAVKYTDIFTNKEHDGLNIDEMASGRENLIALVDQSINDIQKKLS